MGEFDAGVDGGESEEEGEDDLGGGVWGEAGGPEGVGVFCEGGEGGESAEEAGGEEGEDPGGGVAGGEVAEEAADEEAAEDVAGEDA